VPLQANPFTSWATVVDCGDIPVTSYDNAYAIEQIERGHHAILARAPRTHADLPNRFGRPAASGDDGVYGRGRDGDKRKGGALPRVITLGGDHTITLPLLRSVTRAYGPISVVHFDSHLFVSPPPLFHRTL
jgi:agmatinase